MSASVSASIVLCQALLLVLLLMLVLVLVILLVPELVIVLVLFCASAVERIRGMAAANGVHQLDPAATAMHCYSAKCKNAPALACSVTTGEIFWEAPLNKGSHLNI